MPFQIQGLQQQAAGHGIRLELPQWFSSSSLSVRRQKPKELRIGQLLLEEGLKPKHPVLIIPGDVPINAVNLCHGILRAPGGSGVLDTSGPL